jgi:hypothetical protein
MCGVRLNRLLTAATLVAAVVASPMIAWSQDSEPEAGGSAFIQRFDQDGDGYITQGEARSRRLGRGPKSALEMESR